MNRTLFTIALVVFLSTLTAGGVDDKANIDSLINHHQQLTSVYYSFQKPGSSDNATALSKSLFIFDSVRKDRATLEVFRKQMTKKQLKRFSKIVDKFDKATR